MKEKLKKYRKTNKLSKKELAKKLNISLETYKEIEKGGEIKDDIKRDIKVLLATKIRKKPTEIKSPKLSTGISDLSKTIDRITSIVSPAESMMNKINKSFALTSIEKIAGIYKPSITSLDYLKDTYSEQNIGLDWLSQFSFPIKAATDSQLKSYTSLQSVFGSQVDSLKPAIEMQQVLAGITEPMNSLNNITDSLLFQTITEKIKKNETTYKNYIDFTSDFTKVFSNSAITDSIYSNYISADSFLHNDKEPSVLDVLSGTSFTWFDNNDNFNEEREIIEQIDNDPELKEQADSFFEELNEIINDDSTEDIDEIKIESLYSKFTRWISETFNKNEVVAKSITQKFFKVLPFILSISLTLSIAHDNRLAHQKTQEQIEEIKSLIIKKNNNDDDDDDDDDAHKEELFKLYKEISDKIDSKSSQKMIATQDVNLRTRRSSKSKILGVVSVSQEVMVIEKKIKWMEIIYVDKRTQKPRTGWVWLEYFK